MLDGVHCGQNGGRVCWIVAGTLCCREVQGSAEEKARICYACDFYRAVLDEEGNDFICAHILRNT